ncbi:hypothetical protein [Flavobacterium aestivum]|uniref:hypothetical protein n=1 Tax=Flavobacterium aestivum TaxID=3003257 RepID=UPI0024823C5D|nr:hypothetical protein [Flavobacterium aestivum]
MRFKTTLILLFSLLMLSCGGSKQTPQESVEKHTTTIKEVVHDTTFVTVPDTATYRALLDCKNGKVVIKEVYTNTEGKTHLKKPKVKIDNNKLSVDCEARAQELFAQWKSQQKETVIEIVKHIPVEVVKSLTFWQKVQIWSGRVFLFLLFFLLVGWFLQFKKNI